MKKVLVAMSGGVDSSVAALLLKKQGYEVYGFFMNASPSGKTIWPSSIKWKEEESMVRKICEIVGVEELFVVDCEQGYENKIIRPMFADYEKGLTPNPDILCNNIGKFPGLLKKAEEIGADFIATGHYARVRKIGVRPARDLSRNSISPPTHLEITSPNYSHTLIYAKINNAQDSSRNCHYELLMAKDKKKDQSYFLVGLGQGVLKKCLFPVGELTKEEVRKIARKNKFPNWNKHGSRGICYLGKIDMKKFLRERVKEKKGIVKNPGGDVIGRHTGMMFFTVGERVGERNGFEISKEYRKKIGGKKLYVAAKEKGNVLVVAPEGHAALRTKKVFVNGMKFICDEDVGKMKARIRHLGELNSGTLRKEKGKWSFVFDKGVEGIAEGQWIVLYKGQRVVGGGEIRLR